MSAVTGEHPIPAARKPKQSKRYPFMADAAQKFNASRVVEALVIGGLTALVVYVTSIPRIESKMDHLSEQLSELKQEVRDVRKDIYAPVVGRNGGK